MTTDPPYFISDPQLIALEAPYTFFMPCETELMAIGVGDLVKLCFEWTMPTENYSAERMWVTVIEAHGDELYGTLDNEPFEKHLVVGAKVSFQRHQSIDIIWAQPDRTPKVLNPRRTYWERCLVDDDVLNQRAKVRYLYREAPDLAAPDDEYPDSGWRIRGPMAYAKGVDTTEAHYVALGAVLNQDDSWLDLVDEPIGSEFSRGADEGRFYSCN